MSVKVTSDELVYLGLCSCVKVLKFMHGLEFDYVQTIRQDPVGLTLQQVFGLVGGDVGNGGEYVSTVSGRAFDTIAMIDPTFPSFVVDIKVLEVIVEVNASGTKIATKKCGVCCEDSGDINMTLST
jgi:hypothetical protein